MNKFILLLAIYASNALADCSDSIKKEIAEISLNGKAIVTYNKDENCFKIINEKNEIEFKKIPGLDKIDYVNKQIEVEISDDAKLMLIGYNTSESSRNYTLFNLNNFEPIKEFNASYAKIINNSESIAFIDDYNIDDNLEPNGLKVYQIKSNTLETLFPEGIFTGPITVRGSWIITETSPKTKISGERLINLINIDSKTRKIIN